MTRSIQTALRERLNDPHLEVSLVTLSDFVVVVIDPTDAERTSFTVYRSSEQSDAKLAQIVIDLAYKHLTDS